MTVETAIKEEQQKLQALKPGLGMLDSVLEDAEAIDLDLPVPENLHGDIEGILADRIESFIGGLLSPSATTTYNFVRDVSEAEFRRACAACSLSASDQRVSELWRLVENDSDDRGRVTVKDIFDLLALSDLEKLVAVFFLKMDIVDGSVRAESVQSALGGYMEDSQIDDLVSEVEALTFPQLRARIKALIDYALGLAVQRSSHQHLTGCLGTEVGVTRRSSCAPHVSRGQRMVSPKKYEERAADGPASSLPRQRHSLFEELEKCQGQQPPRSGSTAPWRSASRSRRTVAADASAAWRGPGTPGRNSGSAPTASRSLCRAC